MTSKRAVTSEWAQEIQDAPTSSAVSRYGRRAGRRSRSGMWWRCEHRGRGVPGTAAREWVELRDIRASMRVPLVRVALSADQMRGRQVVPADLRRVQPARAHPPVPRDRTRTGNQLLQHEPLLVSGHLLRRGARYPGLRLQRHDGKVDDHRRRKSRCRSMRPVSGREQRLIRRVIATRPSRRCRSSRTSEPNRARACGAGNRRISRAA